MTTQPHGKSPTATAPPVEPDEIEPLNPDAPHDNPNPGRPLQPGAPGTGDPTFPDGPTPEAEPAP